MSAKRGFQDALRDVLLPILAIGISLGWVEGALRGRQIGAAEAFWCGLMEAVIAASLHLPCGLLAALACWMAGRRRDLDAVTRQRAAIAGGLALGLTPPLTQILPLPFWPNAAVALVLAAGLWRFRGRMRIPGSAWLAAISLLTIMAAVILPRIATERPRTHETRLAPAAGPALPADSPSILLISIDTLRNDRVGAIRNGASLTPFLDRLASEGRRLHCTAPANQTRPSHISLLTGADPMRHGATGNHSRMPEELPTLAELLHAAGWRTAAVVSNPVLRSTAGLARGFEVYDDSLVQGHSILRASQLLSDSSSRYTRLAGLPGLGPRLTRLLWVIGSIRLWQRSPTGVETLAQAEVLLRQMSEDQRPFFLFVHFMDPHAEYQAPAPFRDQFRQPADQMVLPWQDPLSFGEKMKTLPRLHRQGLPAAAHLLAALERSYDEEVLFVDDCVRRLVESTVAASGDRSVRIVVTADHGEHFLEHGLVGHANSLFEPLLDVPLIVWGFRPEELAQTTSTTEGIPRLLARSFLGPEAERELAYGSTRDEHGIRIHAWDDWLCIRHGRAKLVLRADDQGGVGEPVSYYRLDEDPGELRNVLNEAGAEVAALIKILTTALAEVVPARNSNAKNDMELEDRLILQELGYAQTH